MSCFYIKENSFMGNNCITQTKNNWETQWCGFMFLKICLLCDLIESSWVLIFISALIYCGFVGILGLTQICSWKRVVPY